MTTRVRLGLLLLVALAAGVAILLLDRRGEPDDTDTAEVGGRERAATSDPELMGAEPAREGPGTGPEPVTAPQGSGVTPGIRRPEGLDLSDPVQRAAWLETLLAKRPVPWDEVAAVVRTIAGPLDAKLKADLLAILRRGDRNGVLQVFAVVQDPSVVPDLLAVLDDLSAAEGARRAALLALAQLPGADRDALVKELEARLTGREAGDAGLLDAIAQRGGPEAARALTEYVLRSPDASRLAQSIAGRIDLVRDPAAAAVFGEALGRTSSREALEALVRIAGASGAPSLAAPLVRLDRDDQPEAVRVQVLEALARIPTTESLTHLIAVSRQSGVFGEHAVLALGNVAGGPPEAQDLLVAELERASLNPRPELARAMLLEAVGSARIERAVPMVVDNLRDSSDRVRASAVRSLGRMGQVARPHVAAVSQQFDRGSDGTRIAVATALGSIGGPDAETELKRLLALPGLGEDLKRTLGYALDAARGGRPGDAD
jgi:HEAT repeat protein